MVVVVVVTDGVVAFAGVEVAAELPPLGVPLTDAVGLVLVGVPPDVPASAAVVVVAADAAVVVVEVLAVVVVVVVVVAGFVFQAMEKSSLAVF